MKSYKPLSRDDERQYHAAMVAGSSHARWFLVESVWWWAYRVAQRSARNRLDTDEIHSAANMGAVEGVAAFDPDKGRLSTIVYWYARKAVMETLRSGRLIHVPTHTLDASNEFHNFAMAAICPNYLGTRDTLIDHDGDQAAYQWHKWQTIKEAVRKLPLRERAAVDGVLAGLSYKEIGIRGGICHERARQDYFRAVKRLKQLVGGDRRCWGWFATSGQDG